MLDINAIRHPKENTYFIILSVISIILYFTIGGLIIVSIAASFGLALLFYFGWFLGILLGAWIFSERFKALLYGDSVHVNQNQYAEIHDIVLKQSKILGITPPPIFVRNSNGYINAFALRIFLKRYIILESSLIDLMLSTKRFKELEMIIGHELGHHAAGHLSYTKGFLTGPGKIIPFLGLAYSRARELTCDRIGYHLCGDVQSAQQALFALALGSNVLMKSGDVNAFVNQETEVPEIAAFINKVTSSHPRTTVRVREIKYYAGSTPLHTIR